MTDAIVVKQTIDDFLTQKIQITIEQKQKKAKGDFSEDEKQKIRDDYELFTWLDKVADNIEKVFLNVSHVAKLTHSSSQAISLRDNSHSDKNLHLITTQTVGSRFLDSGYSDAKVSPIAEFLSLPVANTNKQLGEFLAEDESYLAKVTDDKAKREYWTSQIKQAYQSQQIRSHTLAKQIYIPIGNDDYHLVSPMYSSSLAHEIAVAVKASNNKENPAKLARKQNSWSDEIYIFYPSVATLGVTKSNHQNVSSLNGQRGGLLFLFPSLPPKWTANPNPPTHIRQILSRSYQGQLFTQVKYLLDMFKQNELFINHDRKLLLKTFIEDIVYLVCDEIMLVRKSQPAGWSQNHQMPSYLAMLLDAQSLQTQGFSQPQISAYLDELKSEIVQWISLNIGDDIRTKSLETLWLKIMTPILQEFYQVLKAE